MRHARLAVLAITITLAVAACSSSSAPAPAASSAGSAGNAVTIANFAFGPSSLTVAVGTTVTWTNSDSTGHTVTADDGSFKSDTLATSATFKQTFATAGTFAYHCSIHTSMTGTITVH